MLLVKTNGQQVAQYPYTLDELYADNPSVYFSSLTNEALAPFNAANVVVTGAPEYNEATQIAYENGCVYNADRARWETAWSVREKTADEIAQSSAEMAASIRGDRNARLSASDWTQVLDAPVDRAAWAAYRQALRDLTAQEGFPFTVVWPQEPV